MKPNHDGFGYTAHGHYACFCGYPVSGQISPISMDHPVSQILIHKMKEAWHAHRLRATYATN